MGVYWWVCTVGCVGVTVIKYCASDELSRQCLSVIAYNMITRPHLHTSSPPHTTTAHHSPLAAATSRIDDGNDVDDDDDDDHDDGDAGGGGGCGDELSCVQPRSDSQESTRLVPAM